MPGAPMTGDRPAPDFTCLGSYCKTETDPLGCYKLSHSSPALVLESCILPEPQG